MSTTHLSLLSQELRNVIHQQQENTHKEEIMCEVPTTLDEVLDEGISREVPTEEEKENMSSSKSPDHPLMPVIVSTASFTNHTTVTTDDTNSALESDSINGIPENILPASTTSSPPNLQSFESKSHQYKLLKFHDNSFDVEKLKSQGLDNAHLVEDFIQQLSSSSSKNKISRPRARPPSIYTHIKQLTNTTSDVTVHGPTVANPGPRKRGRPKGSTTKVRHKMPNNGMNLWNKPIKPAPPKHGALKKLDNAFLNLAAQNPHLFQNAGSNVQLLNLSQEQAFHLLYQQQQQQQEIDQQQKLYNQSLKAAEQALSNNDINNLQHFLNGISPQTSPNVPRQHHQSTTNHQLATMQHILNNSISLADYTRLMQAQQQPPQPSNILDMQLQQNIMNLEKMLQNQALEQHSMNIPSNNDQLDMLLKQIQSTIQPPSVPSPPAVQRHEPKVSSISHSIASLSNSSVSHSIASLSNSSKIPVLPKISSPSVSMTGVSVPHTTTSSTTQHTNPPSHTADETKQLLEMIEKLSKPISDQLETSLPVVSPSIPTVKSVQNTHITSSQPQSVSSPYDKISDLEQLISSLKSGSPIKSEPECLPKHKPLAQCKSFVNMSTQLLPKTRGRPPGSISSPSNTKQTPTSADGKRHRGRPRKYPQEFYSVVNGKVKYPGARERKLFYPLDFKHGEEQNTYRNEQKEVDLSAPRNESAAPSQDTNGHTATNPTQSPNNTIPQTEDSVSPKMITNSETPTLQRKKRGRPKGSKNKPCIITTPEQLLELRAQYPDTSSVWEGLPQFKQNQITAVLSGLNQKMFRQAAFQI